MVFYFNFDLSSPGVILAFGVSCTKAVKMVGQQKNVTIHFHSVIYKLLDLLKVRMSPVPVPAALSFPTGARGGDTAVGGGGGGGWRGCGSQDFPTDRSTCCFCWRLSCKEWPSSSLGYLQNPSRWGGVDTQTHSGELFSLSSLCR